VERDTAEGVRIPVSLDQVAPSVIDATVAAEDQRFWSHPGIDPLAIGRAALTLHSDPSGASTLTQQLVRSFFLSNERTFWRKLREAFMAVALEVRYGKDDLMHAYVNEIYLGQDGARAVHGFGLASRFYFSRPLAELDLHQVALLVALVRGPGYYDPYRHPERAAARRNLVLEMMAEVDAVSAASAREAAGMPLDLCIIPTDGFTAKTLRIESDHKEFRQISDSWAASLRTAFNALPAVKF